MSSRKMPDITNEKFTGKEKVCADFCNYLSICQTIVLNNSELDNVQKFIYFKSQKEEKRKIIENFSSNNFIPALDILLGTYQKKVAHQGFGGISCINENNPNSLTEFMVNIKQNKKSMKNLQLPVDNSELILVYVLTQQ